MKPKASPLTERIRAQQRSGALSLGDIPLADALKIAAIALERLARGLCPHCGLLDVAGSRKAGRCRYCPSCGGRYQT